METLWTFRFSVKNKLQTLPVQENKKTQQTFHSIHHF